MFLIRSDPPGFQNFLTTLINSEKLSSKLRKNTVTRDYLIKDIRVCINVILLGIINKYVNTVCISSLMLYFMLHIEGLLKLEGIVLL